MADLNLLPHHNLLHYSDDLLSGSGWVRPSTVTDDRSNVNVPYNRYGMTRCYKCVLQAAGDSRFFYSASGYAYVLNGVVYRLSILVRYTNQQWITFGVTGNSTYVTHFDIQNRVIGSTTAGSIITNPTIESDGSNWSYITVRYLGTTSINASVRLVVQAANSGTLASYPTPVGGETIHVSSPQVQRYVSDSAEYKNYIGTTDYVPKFGPALPILSDNNVSTSYKDEIADAVWSGTAEDTWGENTMGGYLEKAKKYVANKITKSSGTYTVYKDDESTTYETGTTSASTRDPS